MQSHTAVQQSVIREGIEQTGQGERSFFQIRERPRQTGTQADHRQVNGERVRQVQRCRKRDVVGVGGGGQGGRERGRGRERGWREKGKERETETERQRDRDRERQRETQTDRGRDRGRDGEIMLL